MLTTEAKKQIATIRDRYKGTPQWLKAPNGNSSNLNELQWLLVRTPNFKRWFGDWENDPQNASKIVDKNGEPMVVYHGTNKGGFSVFNTKGGDLGKAGGAFTSSMYEVAMSYASGNLRKNIYPLFLNVRNPYVTDAKGKFWNDI